MMVSELDVSVQGLALAKFESTWGLLVSPRFRWRRPERSEWGGRKRVREGGEPT